MLIWHYVIQQSLTHPLTFLTLNFVPTVFLKCLKTGLPHMSGQSLHRPLFHQRMPFSQLVFSYPHGNWLDQVCKEKNKMFLSYMHKIWYCKSNISLSIISLLKLTWILLFHFLIKQILLKVISIRLEWLMPIQK